MKIFIITDLEGPAGVNLWSQTREGETPAKRAAMHLLTAETNAAVEGTLDADSQAQAFVYDGHGSGGLIYEEIHPKAHVIMHGAGDMAPLRERVPDIDALMFVGQHAMANTPGAPLCHTFSSRNIDYYKLNGEFIGEFGFHAARFGEFNIPTILLARDDKACAEASSAIPEIITAETKKGLGTGVQRAAHLSPAGSRERIRASAAKAVKKLPQILPYKIEPPYELEIRVLPGLPIDNFLERKCDEAYVKDERTVVLKAKRLENLLY